MSVVDEAPADRFGLRLGQALGPEEMPARVGRYRVLRVLGEGGMGIVYAAFDDELARPVAVKLVRDSGGLRTDTRARARMRREAQAMARLSHPNVVQIHDVGERDGELFLTMELIHGETLDAWLAELGPPRVRATRWREVIEVFVAAGRGLAAAHAAGLVHRDFKPANVLIGRGGIVKVGDFGLAREEQEVEATSDAGSAADGELGERISETGALIGTRAYLAPELLAGQTSSAASDQFAFCVALHEALTGQRPYAGDDFRALAANLLAGRRRSAPEGIVVPARIMAVIDRGLAREPGDRWPGVDALLAALLDDPARRRRRRVALVGIVLGVVGLVGGLGFAELRRRASCDSLAGALAERWNPSSQEALAQAFARTDAPGASETWDRVRPRVAAWVQRWGLARREACDTAGEQPERASRTAICLEHERWELEALLDVFAAAERTTVIEAAAAVAGLPEVARCDDLVLLAADASLRPVGPEVLAREVALRRDLARVLALAHAGQHTAARTLAQRSLQAARGLGDPVAEAEALARLGAIEWRMADFVGAEQSLLAGHLLAARVEHERVAYATARDLAWVVGVRLARPGEGKIWLELARTSLIRGGEDPETEPDVFERQGELLDAEGRYVEALAAHERALALQEQRQGDGHPDHAESLLAIGRVQAALGDVRALASFERARALAAASLGPAHPIVANADNELGVALFAAGRVDESVAALRRALATRERALGADDPGLANILVSLAGVLQSREASLEAQLLLERAVQILARTLGREHPDTLNARGSLATIKAQTGQVDEAVVMLRDVVAATERTLGPAAPLLSSALTNLAYCLVQRGDHAGALPLLRRVVALDEARLGPGDVEVAADLDVVVSSAIAVGEHAAALSDAHRALAIRVAALPADDPALASSYDNVALALLALGRLDAAREQHARARAARGERPVGGEVDELAELRELLLRLRPRR